MIVLRYERQLFRTKSCFKTKVYTRIDVQTTHILKNKLYGKALYLKVERKHSHFHIKDKQFREEINLNEIG